MFDTITEKNPTTECRLRESQSTQVFKDHTTLSASVVRLANMYTGNLLRRVVDKCLYAKECVMKGSCIICRTVHQKNQCDLLKNKCIRCLSSQHQVSSCRWQLKPLQGGIWCYFCSLPFRYEGWNIHGKNEGCRTCSTGGKDYITRVCWLAWRDCGVRVLFQRELAIKLDGEVEFVNWMQAPSLEYPMLLNCTILFDTVVDGL